ncbi:MAG: flagellar motor switch protein FliG [Spirochaetota bacterium]
MNKKEKGISAYKKTLKQAGRKNQPEIKPEEIYFKKSKSRGRSAQQKMHEQHKKPPTDVEHTQVLLKATGDEKNYRKAAKFLMLLGKDGASKVLTYLKPAEIEAISREIVLTDKIDGPEAESLLREFGLKKERGAYNRGGIETIKAILLNAFGQEKGEAILRKTIPFGGEKPFDFLNDFEYHQILLLLRNESNSVISIILPFLEPKKASLILRELPSDSQKAIIKRIARMGKIAPEVLVRAQDILRERIRTQGKVVSQEIDGKAALAEILKHMNIAEEEKILATLEEINPDLSEEVREKLFTIEVIFQITDKEFQKVLRDFADHEIAIILKGKPEEVRNKFLSNVSERRQSIIKDEYEHLGSLRKSEVDKVTKDFLEYLRAMNEEGRLVINRENEYFTT